MNIPQLINSTHIWLAFSLELFGHHWICAAMDIIELVFQFTNIHISVALKPGRRPASLEPMQTFNFSRYCQIAFQKDANHSLAVALHSCQHLVPGFSFLQS